MPRRKKSPDPDAPFEVLIDGRSIRHIRVDLDLDQAELARLMGVSPATLSRIENGKSVMSRPYYYLLRYTIREVEARTGKRTTFVFQDV